MNKRGVLSLLALSTIASICLALSLVVTLSPGDRITCTRGLFLMILGFIFFLSLFDFLNHVALKTNPGLKIRKKYQLTMFDVLDISNKAVSAIQAALSCLAGTVVCLWSCTRDFLYSSHFVSEAYAWFGAAYFFYDIWSMYKVHISKLTRIPAMISNQSNNEQTEIKKTFSYNEDSNVISEQPFDEETSKKNLMIEKRENMTFFAYCWDQPMIIVHHLFIGGFGFLVIVYLRGGLGDCIFGSIYLMELSTPFVSIRSILSRMKLKASKIYVVNGIAMLAIFFFCRILMMPYLCVIYSKTIGLPLFEAIKGLPTGCKISISILQFLQVYWFSLMVIGAVKIFCPTGKNSEKIETLGISGAIKISDKAS